MVFGELGPFGSGMFWGFLWWSKVCRVPAMERTFMYHSRVTKQNVQAACTRVVIKAVASEVAASISSSKVRMNSGFEFSV